MNDFERKEYKNLLSDYTKASERILELEKENLELKQDILSFEDYSYDLDCEKDLLEQVWNKEEWCKGIPLSAESLKSLFNYNKELFEENLALDKKVLELEKENQELKQDIVSFEDYSYDLDCEKEQLEKENSDLKAELSQYKNNTIGFTYGD